MRNRASCILAFGVCMAGCSHQPAQPHPTSYVSQYFPNNPSLASLTEVWIGMTAGDVQRRRPSTVPAPYVGLRETIGSDTVWYYFPNPPDEPDRSPDWQIVFGKRDVDRDSPVHKVAAWSRMRSVDAARAKWVAMTNDLAQRPHRSTLECFEYVQGGQRIEAAIKLFGEITAGALLRPQRVLQGPSGPVFNPAAVVTFVTDTLARTIPETLPRTAIPCP